MNVRALAVIAALVLAGCEDSTPSSDARDLQLNLQAVPQSHLVACDLSATASVDNGPEVSLAIGADDSISDRIEGVSVGMHTLRIVVMCNHSEFGLVELANTDLSVDVRSGTNRVTFTQADYNYAVDDGDGYNNLQEIVASSNPFSTTDFPDDGSLPSLGYWRTMRWRQSNWN